MYNLIVVSHGNLAEQFVSTSEMILGKQQGISALCLKSGETKESFEIRLEEQLNQFNGSDVLVLADLFGGTPFNSAITLILKGTHHIQLLAGVNLPMVIHALMNKNRELSSVVDEIKSTAVDGIQNANKVIKCVYRDYMIN